MLGILGGRKDSQSQVIIVGEPGRCEFVVVGCLKLDYAEESAGTKV